MVFANVGKKKLLGHHTRSLEMTVLFTMDFLHNTQARSALTVTSFSTIDAIMAKLGSKSGSDRKIGKRIRIFQVKRVIKV